MDIINAAILFLVVAVIALTLLILGGILWVVFFYLCPYDPPPKPERKRVRSLFRAKGPAQTRISNPRVIIDPAPEAHGDGAWLTRRAAYPEV